MQLHNCAKIDSGMKSKLGLPEGAKETIVLVGTAKPGRMG